MEYRQVYKLPLLLTMLVMIVLTAFLLQSRLIKDHEKAESFPSQTIAVVYDEKA